MRPKEYIEKVRSREIYDPVLTFQLSNDFHVRRVMPNYLPNDEESCHCATLLQWDNIYYQPPTQEFVDKEDHRACRTGAVADAQLQDARRRLRAGRVLRRCRIGLQERLRALPRVFQRTAHGQVQQPGRGAVDPRPGPVYGGDTRPFRRAGHQLQHQHHYGQHAPTSKPTAPSTTWDSSVGATVRTTCTRRCTLRPTRSKAGV